MKKIGMMDYWNIGLVEKTSAKVSPFHSSIHPFIHSSIIILAFSFALAQDVQVTQHSEVWGATGDVTTTHENPLSGVHSVTLNAGQPFIGNSDGTQYSADFGIWSVFLKEPDAPIVTATDGAQAHPELIRVSWESDKLSPPADFSTAIPAGGSQTTGNWVVTRDSSWRANVPADDPAFDDDQSIFPGTLYEYGVRVSNEYGYSPEGLDIGFTIPNGKIAGRVFTPGPTPGAPWTPVGNPVADVEVSLSPIMGKSVLFDGSNDYVSVDANYSEEVSSDFTIEFWYNVGPAPTNATILDWGSRLRIYHTASKIKAKIGGNIVQADLSNAEVWEHVAVSYNGNTLSLYQNGMVMDSIAYTNDLPAPSKLLMGKKRDNTEFFDGYLDDIRIWETAHSEEDIFRNKDRALFGNESGLLGYWKFDENQSTISFDMTEPRENAQMMNGASWSDEFAQVKLSAFTDVSGDYEIRGVWYDATNDNGTTYTATPYKLNHMVFSPMTETATITRNDPTMNDVKFLDESLFTVSGVITYNGTTCPVVDAEILLDSASTRPRTFTNEDGEWSLDLEPDESGDISVRFGGYFQYDTTTIMNQTIVDTSYMDGHTFLLSEVEQGYTVENINDDIAGIDFANAKTETLTVKIGGGECFFPIGNVDITLETTPSCYSHELLTAQATGDDNEVIITGLPPLNYAVSITHTNTEISFQSKNISLMNGSKSMEFMYKAPLSVELTELPWGTGCAIVEQHQKDSLLVNIFEQYGGYDGVTENKCYLDSFSVQSFDNWAGMNSEPWDVVTPIETKGKLYYKFQPSNPNLLDGGDHPFQKKLTILAEDPIGRQSTTDVWAHVTGTAVTDGSDFVSRPAQTNKLPFFVLRDPPGDLSYSYLSDEQAVCKTLSMVTEDVEDEDNFVTASLGIDMSVSIGWTVPFIGTSIAFDTEIDVTADYENTWGISKFNLNMTESEVCVTTSELYQTNGDGLIVGDGADIFVGAGLNVTYSRMVDLSLNDACEVQLDTSHGLSNITGFHSFYVYSDYHIRNNLIPDLVELLAFAQPADTAALASSLRYWQKLLTTNEAAKANAVATNAESNTGESITNISFDALASYEYSTTTDSTASSSWEVSVTDYSSDGGAGGLLVNGIGVVGGRTDTDTHTETNSGGTATTYSRTMGFSFGDDDPGDAFTVNIKRDTVWNMPVFELVAGQSSNPWEVGTFKRQWASLFVEPPIQVDVEPDESAVFTLGLGNQSETGETWAYNLSMKNETNPHGAILRVNGQNLASGIDFEIEAGQSTEATLTVERGPVEYIYDGLTLQFAPPGEIEIAELLGVDPQNGEDANVSARFITPCTSIELSFADGSTVWDVSQADSNELSFIFSEYDTTDIELEYIVLEYSLVSENDWFEVDSSKFAIDTLVSAGQDFVVASWDVTNLDDGNYKIRAKSKCRLRQSTSMELFGSIDRVSPEMLGVAEPADGVLNMNDQIQITFTENIDCDGLNANSAELFFALSGDEVASEITCNEDVIIISPATSVANYEIENQVLRAEVHNIQDLVGNGMLVDTLAWEFTVNRNPIGWNTNNVNLIAFTGEENTFSTTLNNIGSAAQSFELTNLPSWLLASPMQGEINPGGTFEITFNVDPNINNGDYSHTLFADCPEGMEPLVVDMIAMCPYPGWEINPFDYQYSMNVTAQISVLGDVSDDIFDRVGTFVDGELRGYTNLVYDETMENYLVYLTVYSNQFTGEEVEFHIWDRTGCMEYWGMDTSLIFTGDTYIGSPSNPFLINASGTIAQNISIESGFTWFSLNLESEISNDLNAVFNGFTVNDGDQITGQSNYAQYQASTSQWVGTLNELNLGKMYMSDMDSLNQLDYIGMPVIADTLALMTNSGWTWLGYLPHENIDVNIAFSSLSATENDLVKDQFNYAQYAENIGWVGPLTRMFPGTGYKLYMETGDTLIYPNNDISRNSVHESTLFEEINTFDPDSLPQEKWVLENIHQYQHSMTVTAVIESDTFGINDPYDMVAALVGDEVQGTARPMYVPALNQYRIFLTVYSNDLDENFEFRIWDNDTKRIYRGAELISFNADDMVGNVLQPLIIEKTMLGILDENFIPDEFMLSQNFPNPFNPITKIGIGVPEISKVKVVVYDILGRQVKTLLNNDLQPGYQLIVWNGTNQMNKPVSSGIYFVVMEGRGDTQQFRDVKKMMVLK